MKKITDQQKEDVLRLHFAEHLPSRQIAARLGMARRTVRAVIAGRQAPLKPRQPRVTQLRRAGDQGFLQHPLGTRGH